MTRANVTMDDLRALSHAELLRLCQERWFCMQLRPRDLIYARWLVASDAAMAASKAMLGRPLKGLTDISRYLDAGERSARLHSRADAIYAELEALREDQS